MDWSICVSDTSEVSVESTDPCTVNSCRLIYIKKNVFSIIEHKSSNAVLVEFLRNRYLLLDVHTCLRKPLEVFCQMNLRQNASNVSKSS